MQCSTPGSSVLHYLPEFAQTHVHWVDEATQPSHPLSSPSPPAFNLSQQQGVSNELALCNPVDQSTPGLLVHHQLPEFTQTSCPLSQWCHPTIPSSVIPVSFCPQSFPASGSFPLSQLFTSDGQSIGASASLKITFLLNTSILSQTYKESRKINDSTFSKQFFLRK